MKSNYIELTLSDDSKFLLNVLHIGWIEANKNGSTITFNLVHYSLTKKVKESYADIKAKLNTI
jgi:hypothetical protein